MKFLIDTNIFLEIILGQEKSKEARDFLARVAEHHSFISDYSLHSIGTILFRQKKCSIFSQFLDDMVMNVGMEIMSLDVEDMVFVVETAKRIGLDFDGAYQYVVAEKNDLTLVSFDTDFDRTQRGRKTPGDIFSN